MCEKLPVIKYNGRKFFGMQKTTCADVVDSSVPLPESLRKLYSSAGVQNNFDCLTVLQHVLMLEAGFLPVNVTEDKCCEEMPFYWRSRTYKILYYHKECPKIRCQMSCIPLRSMLMSYGKIHGMKPCDKICIILPVRPYVHTTKGHSYKDPASVYHKITKIAENFKQNFCFALLQKIYCVAQVEPLIGLPSIPANMKLHIMSYLPAESLISMSAVNKEFRDIAKSNFLWKTLCQQDFSDELPSDTSGRYNWKKFYINSYSRKKDLKKWMINRLKARLKKAGIDFTRPFIVSDPDSSSRDPHAEHDRPESGLSPELQQAVFDLASIDYEHFPAVFKIVPPNH